MSDTKFTPGPYVAYIGPMGMDKGLNPFFKGIVAILRADGDDSAVVMIDRDEEANAYEANAHLLAAAPAMYEALVVAVALLRNVPHVPDEKHWEQMESALKKARGEA